MSTDDDAKVSRLRELLPATSAGIYLDTATFGPLPAETAAAMREADDWELKVGRATVGRVEDLEQRVEEARAVLAALLVADPSEVVLTPGIDAALELAGRLSNSRDATILDASYLAGAQQLEASALGAEFVAFACDKWLLGPEQTAALWVSPRVGGSAVGTAPMSGLSRTAVLGLARSVGWIEMYVGLDWAYAHTAALVADLRESLLRIPGLKVQQVQPAVISFAVDGWSVEDTVDELRRRVFAIVGVTHDQAQVQASVGWFNTDSEISTFVGAVRDIAENTPDSIPRRLPMLGQ
jgi:selenocysteine lyase/cysteine desulfurase